MKKSGTDIVARFHGQVVQRITAQDLEKLPEVQLRHIKVLEQSMDNHYMVWMKSDLHGILSFLENSGIHLDEHHMHIRQGGRKGAICEL